MKILIFSFLFYSHLSFAEYLSFGATSITGTIESSIGTPDMAQAVLKCRFHKAGQTTRAIEKRPLTRLEMVNESTAKIFIKGATVRDWIPGYEIYHCSYSLLYFAKKEGRSIFKEITLAGDLYDYMDPEEIKRITDKTYLSELVSQQLNPLAL